MTEEEAPVICLPRQQSRWQNPSDITILEFWSLLKAATTSQKVQQ